VSREKKLQEKFDTMKLTLAGRIDANVTADTSKLIRMPNSLHGGSGFLAASVPDLEKFDPMRDAPAFGEEKLKIKATEAIPALRIKEFDFGPLASGDVRELAMHSAVYLLCKKAAVLA